jgi:hypothetical protein
MTASRTAYQNNYPSTSASVSAEMHHTWHPHPPTSHSTSNGTNRMSSARTKPTSTTNASTTSGKVGHNKSDFYKNGKPAEVIVIDDSESPAPAPQSSTKRKRENSISSGTTVSAVTKRARKSQNDEAALLTGKGPFTSTQKPHSVAWFKNLRGIYRAKEVMVPKVEEV